MTTDHAPVSNFPDDHRRCGQCCHRVGWIDARRAVLLGMDQVEAMTFLGVGDSGELRWWTCANCRVVGVAAGSSGYWQRRPGLEAVPWARG
jgi:hypothetical protein